MSEVPKEKYDLIKSLHEAYALPPLAVLLASFQQTVGAYILHAGPPGSQSRRSVILSIAAALEGIALGFYEGLKNEEVSNSVPAAQDDVGDTQPSNNDNDPKEAA